MTYEKLQALLYKTIQRDDLLEANSADYHYGTIINQALQECQRRKSWQVMKDRADVVILSGTKSIALPEDFKEFQNLRPPIHIVLDDPSVGGEILRPVNVTFEEVELRRLWVMAGVAWDVQAWVEKTEDGATLYIGSQAGENITFRVKYYKYLPELSGASDTSPLELAFPRIVLLKAKEIAFEVINDMEMFAQCATAFETLFTRDSIQDNRSEVSGRETRM